LSTRVVVVVAAAVAVAMLPMAGLAWAQEQTSTIAPTDRDDPRIKPISPNPGSHTRDRTPTIKAKVTDNDHDLDKRDIKLYLDRDRIRNFDYSRRRNVLEYTPNKRLSFGKHTVKVVAEAARGEKATEKWSFRVVR
jgi:cytochrome c